MVRPCGRARMQKGQCAKPSRVLLLTRRSVAAGGRIDQIPEFDGLVDVASDETTRKLSALENWKSKQGDVPDQANILGLRPPVAAICVCHKSVTVANGDFATSRAD